MARTYVVEKCDNRWCSHFDTTIIEKICYNVNRLHKHGKEF